jgi:hypothetical protein
MKNKIFNYRIIFLAIASSFMFSSCFVEDDKIDFGDTPVLVQFESTAATAIFIKDDVNPETFTYDIPVVLIGGKNQPISKSVDVTVSVDPSSTATAGGEFNLLDTMVTIPAGETSASIQIEVLSGNLDTEDPKTLVLRIDSASLTISESFKTSIEIQAACPFDIAPFYGTYDATGDGGNYTVEVVEGPDENTLLVTNLTNTGGETVIELSTDPTNPTITYRSEEFDAALSNHSTYGSIWATTVTPETSNYGSCDNSLYLEFKRCVSIGCFGGTKKAQLTKQ